MKKNKTCKLVLTSIMATFIVISTFLSVTLPIAGITTTFHLGNITCLLAGILLRPMYGGLAAAIGSLTFDVLNPLYIASAPFTVTSKFTMAFVCGIISYCKNKHGENKLYNVIGAISGNLIYVLLRATKCLFVNLYIFKMEPLTATLLTLNGTLISLCKAAITVTIVIIWVPIVQKKMKSARLE